MEILENVIRKTKGDRVYYFGSILSSSVRANTFVPVIETSPKTKLIELTEEGYQRPGSQPRMNRFRDFLKTHEKNMIPPVILSGRGRWKFVAYETNGILGKLEITGPAAIIDGQHRIGGFVSLYESEGIEREIDFLLIDNLTVKEETAEFVIVNDTQQGVPKSLSAFNKLDNELLEGIGQKTEQDSIRIAWALSVRDDSPFNGMIARTKLGPEHLFALHSVAQQVEKMFSHGAFDETTVDEKINISIKYWVIIQDAHPEQFADLEKLGVKGLGRKAFDHKLLELTGFIAWSLIGNQILHAAFNSDAQEMDWDAVEKSVLKLAQYIDWRKTGQYRNATGMVGGPLIRRDMERILARPV